MIPFTYAFYCKINSCRRRHEPNRSNFRRIKQFHLFATTQNLVQQPFLGLYCFIYSYKIQCEKSRANSQNPKKLAINVFLPIFLKVHMASGLCMLHCLLHIQRVANISEENCYRVGIQLKNKKTKNKKEGKATLKHN